MSRVFIPQQPLRWSEKKEALVPKFPMEPAERFGKLVYLTGPRAAPWTHSAIEQIKVRLREMQYNPHLDYVLLLGNPGLIGAAMVFAAREALQVEAPVRVQQWNGRQRDYIIVEMDLR